MDFGRVALAGGFLESEQFENEQKYPLRLFFCDDCCAVQVVDKVSADVLFQDYFYFSSSIGTLREHFRNYAAEVTSRFLSPPSASVLEFGCNDGVLLQPLADEGIGTVIGVDPASNVLSSVDDQRLTLINDFFNESVADSVVERYGEMDMVLANNVYAHIPDIQGATQAVARVLKKDGVFIFEDPYLGEVIEKTSFDQIYDEHAHIFSVLALAGMLEECGLKIVEIENLKTHGGSNRIYAKKATNRSIEISQNVEENIQKEQRGGLNKLSTYLQFSERVVESKSHLVSLLGKYKNVGKKIISYGATYKSSTIFNYCGINTIVITYD